MSPYSEVGSKLSRFASGMKRLCWLWQGDFVLLCFVDESNQGDFHGFAALVADEHCTKRLTAKMNGIMSQAADDWGLDRTTEFHAYPMFHGKEEWVVVPVRARIGLFHKVVDAIVDEPVDIILQSVDEKRLRARQAKYDYPVNFPPEEVCFRHILQRVDDVAQRDETHALIIADDRGDRERHRERFATYQTEGTPGVYRHTTLDTLLDTVHFAPSHRSRMLQAADVLAFINRRFHTVTETDPRAAENIHKLWEKIMGQRLFDHGSWP